MTTLRIVAVLVALATPALGAPLLVAYWCQGPRRLWTWCAGLVCVIPLAAPWPLSGRAPDWIVLLVAIAGAIVTLKTFDWLVHPRPDTGLVRVWLALTIWPALQIEDVGIRITGKGTRFGLAAPRFIEGGIAAVCGLALAVLGRWLDLRERAFLVDSSFKILEIYLLGTGANHFLVASFALAGYRIFDAFRYPIAAHSLLDLWSRYHVWIHRWLKAHLFEPIGRRRRKPAAGILAAFGFSGLAHDYLFLPVTRELLGWQFAFFILHGVGAIGAAWVGHRYRALAGRCVPRGVAVAGTIGFVLATAPLFTRCFDRMFDLHRDLGGWVLDGIEDSVSAESSSGSYRPILTEAASLEPCERRHCIRWGVSARDESGTQNQPHFRAPSPRRRATCSSGLPPGGGPLSPLFRGSKSGRTVAFPWGLHPRLHSVAPIQGLEKKRSQPWRGVCDRHGARCLREVRGQRASNHDRAWR